MGDLPDGPSMLLMFPMFPMDPTKLLCGKVGSMGADALVAAIG